MYETNWTAFQRKHPSLPSSLNLPGHDTCFRYSTGYAGHTRNKKPIWRNRGVSKLEHYVIRTRNACANGIFRSKVYIINRDTFRKDNEICPTAGAFVSSQWGNCTWSGVRKKKIKQRSQRGARWLIFGPVWRKNNPPKRTNWQIKCVPSNWKNDQNL